MTTNRGFWADVGSAVVLGSLLVMLVFSIATIISAAGSLLQVREVCASMDEGPGQLECFRSIDRRMECPECPQFPASPAPTNPSADALMCL